MLPKICESMKSFSRSWLDGLELYWSWSLVFICFVVCAMVSVILTVIFLPVFSSFDMIWPLVVGGVGYLIIVSAYGFVYYGSEIRLWNGSITVARFIAKLLARLKLIISVATLNAPIRTDKEVKVFLRHRNNFFSLLLAQSVFYSQTTTDFLLLAENKR